MSSCILIIPLLLVGGPPEVFLGTLVLSVRIRVKRLQSITGFSTKPIAAPALLTDGLLGQSLSDQFF